MSRNRAGSASNTFDTFVIALLLCSYSSLTIAITDQSDVGALQIVYSSLNSPPQLTGWKLSGGDPCGESWKGITCEGSSIVAIQVSGLGLNGTLGYLLSNLFSLRTLDVSNNNIHDAIPYQLPPNLTNLNLAGNNLSGNLPYSISLMTSLNYLNVSHNLLSQTNGDVFANLRGLSSLDLSFNNLTGDLPNSYSSLSNLSTLYLQNNQLTGSVNVLVDLPLVNLNIANNHFSGWIPKEFKSISNFKYDGNSFTNGPAPPPPPYTSPPPGKPQNNQNRTEHTPQGSNGHKSDSDEGFKTGPIIGIVIGSVLGALLVMVALIFCLRKVSNDKDKKESITQPPMTALSVGADKVNMDMQEQRVKSTASVMDLKPLPAERVIGERTHGDNGSARRLKSPISATSYTVASLQTATNSFSQEYLVGEGSLGRVYRAEFPSGKILAVKKIDSSALSLQEEDNFLEAVSNMQG